MCLAHDYFADYIDSHASAYANSSTSPLPNKGNTDIEALPARGCDQSIKKQSQFTVIFFGQHKHRLYNEKIATAAFDFQIG